jgi:hypothetical protein
MGEFMSDRRTVVFSLAGTLAAAAMTRACIASQSSQATPLSQVSPDTPKATVIPGKPPILDFGDGVRVPCNKEAFLTLWEGKTYWLTFGAGRSHYSEQAQGGAVQYARASMKLLLMTLAFAPDRLDHVDGGGWRLKSRDIKDFVHGDIELPGNPFWPTNDTDMGFGNLDAGALGTLNFGTLGSVGGKARDVTGSWNYAGGYAAYVVFKKDASLDYVRSHAQILPE